MQMGKENMQSKKPMILVLAGPNGSGKSTITTFFDKVGKYTNADDIVAATGMDNMEAAILVDKMRYGSIDKKEDFTNQSIILKNCSKYVILCMFMIIQKHLQELFESIKMIYRLIHLYREAMFMFPKVVQVIPMKDYSVFVDACTVMNDTLAWDISGNRDAGRCIDIDPDTLYELPYCKEQIA